LKTIFCIVIYLGLSIGSAYTQTYSKSFLINRLNTLSINSCVVDGNFFITGGSIDTGASIGIDLRHFIAKIELNSGRIDTFNSYRPEVYYDFVGSYYNTKLNYINNKLVCTGYSEDTMTGNHSYLICFYDTNASLSHYFAFPTYIPNGGIYTLEFLNNYYYTSGIKDNFHRPFLLKADTLGNKIFEIPYVIGASEANTEINEPQSMIVTDSSDILIVFNGFKEFFGYPDLHRKVYKTIMIKTDTLGNEKWRWIDTSNNGQAAYSFQKTSDGGYISCGSYIGYRAFNDTDDFCTAQPYIVKWNADLTKQWEMWYDKMDVRNTGGEFFDIKELADGSFIACGYGGQTVDKTVINGGWLQKVDRNGNVIWRKFYKPYGYQSFDYFFRLYDLDVLANGDIIAVGEYDPVGHVLIPQQGWLLRVDSNGCIVDSNWCGFNNIEVEPYTSMNKNNELEIFPNPANEMINLTMDEFENLKIGDLKVEVYDAIGRLILHQKIATSQEQPIGFRNDSQGHDVSLQLNISKLGTGLYFVRVIDNENKQIGSGKFVKE
jgi:hypothetical protein